LTRKNFIKPIEGLYFGVPVGDSKQSMVELFLPFRSCYSWLVPSPSTMLVEVVRLNETASNTRFVPAIAMEVGKGGEAR